MIDNLVNHAPEALNILKELGQALGDDEDFSSTILNPIAKESSIQVSDYPHASGSDWFWQLGRISLPNDGHHATITVNACNGWNLNFRGGGSGVNSNGYNITNYQMTAHIYSSTPNTSRAVDPGSLGVDAARYIDPTYSLLYSGFVVAQQILLLLWGST